MKIKLDIDPTITEDTISIKSAEMTDDIEKIIRCIEAVNTADILNGRKDETIYRISLKDVHRFFIEDKVMRMQTSKHTFSIDKRLYEVEELTGVDFIKISKSEIVNIHFLDHLSMTPSGQIKIYMTNGEFTYSSRRYLKTIKERLSL
ncbi:LytTR family DNA-binding domain-containing protein [Salinicoccus carnicancri]|uniref:LytTR family DNA-binding domain-containing protein n=1 Tax=Salinicoccus carnicancri TaxID=558170 RepID=UPI0002F0AE94|nr:LytTR family DNA-binding domain-containing protein [Salinicoccus carnicancri]